MKDSACDPPKNFSASTREAECPQDKKEKSSNKRHPTDDAADDKRYLVKAPKTKQTNKKKYTPAKMHLMCNVDASGKRAYTLKKVLEGKVTKSAHPARFSPDDKWSRHRITLKKRFGLLQTEKSEFLSFAVPRSIYLRAACKDSYADQGCLCVLLQRTSRRSSHHELFLVFFLFVLSGIIRFIHILFFFKWSISTWSKGEAFSAQHLA